MWRERILQLCPAAEFVPGCSPAVLAALQDAIGVALPPELRDVLGESDGISAEHGLGLIWSSQRIRDDNLRLRSSARCRELYMPFDPLLFFADAGNGDQFAFAIRGGVISRADVFAWEHENDSRTWVAPSLERYVELWLSGSLTV